MNCPIITKLPDSVVKLTSAIKADGEQVLVVSPNRPLHSCYHSKPSFKAHIIRLKNNSVQIAYLNAVRKLRQIFA